MAGLLAAVGKVVFGMVETILPNPVLTKAEESILNGGVTVINDREDFYIVAQDYYDGNQDDPTLIDPTVPKRASDLRTYQKVHNICAKFIDAVVERLAVSGIAVTDLAQPDLEFVESESEKQSYADLNARMSRAAWRWWKNSRMDEHQNTLFAQSFIKGDAFIQVDWDNLFGMPKFVVHDALGIVPDYDANNNLVALYKSWSIQELNEKGEAVTRLRVNKYVRGVIYKYTRLEGDKEWSIYNLDTDPRTGASDNGIILLVDATGVPLDIPWVHFKNRPRGKPFGHSMMRELIPMQDEFNARVAATSDAMAFQGTPQAYTIGVTIPQNPATGLPIALKPGPGNVWALQPSNPQNGGGLVSNGPQVGSLPAGDVSSLQDATDKHLRTAGALNNIPTHLIWPEGSLPSGESLKVAETPLIAVAYDRQKSWGNAVADAYKIAFRMYGMFSGAVGDTAFPTWVDASVEWESPETRSELTIETVLSTAGPDMPWEDRMKARGLTDEQIEELRARLQEQGTAPPTPESEALGAVDGQIGAGNTGAVPGADEEVEEPDPATVV